MSQIGNVKTAIQAKLQTLVGTSIGTLLVSDLKRDPLDAEIQTYPLAILNPPAIATVDRYETNGYIRELTFTITVVEKQENITSITQVEDLMETLLNLFDASITLGNTAVGGIVPTSSFPEPFIHNGKSLVVFDIIVKARTLTNLTYN